MSEDFIHVLRTVKEPKIFGILPAASRPSVPPFPLTLKAGLKPMLEAPLRQRIKTTLGAPSFCLESGNFGSSVTEGIPSNK